MGKMSELSMLLDDLIECGRKLTETAQALRDFYTDTGPETADRPPEQKKAEPDPAPEKEEPVKAYTKEDVRALLAAKAGEENGRFRSEVKALVKKYGNGGSLTNISADDYPALVDELGRIGNAG